MPDKKMRMIDDRAVEMARNRIEILKSGVRRHVSLIVRLQTQIRSARTRLSRLTSPNRRITRADCTCGAAPRHVHRKKRCGCCSMAPQMARKMRFCTWPSNKCFSDGLDKLRAAQKVTTTPGGKS